MSFKGGRKQKESAGNKQVVKGGVRKGQNANKKQKFVNKKGKAAAPTADDLDKELMKYMGEEYVAKKLDSELDAYFKGGDHE